MGRDPADSFPLDTGDVYIVVVNDLFEVQEWHQVSFNDPQESEVCVRGSMSMKIRSS